MLVYQNKEIFRSSIPGTISRISIEKNEGVVTQSFWLKSQKGRELNIEIRDPELCLEAGDVVTVTFAHTAGIPDRIPVFIANHTTHKQKNLKTPEEINAALKIDVVTPASIFRTLTFSSLISIIVMLGLSDAAYASSYDFASTNNLIVSGFCAAVYVLYRAAARYRRTENLYGKLRHYLKLV